MEITDEEYSRLSPEEKLDFIREHWGYDAESTFRRLIEYENAYYAAIREQLEIYSLISEAFPQHLFGKRRISIVFAAKAVLIIHYQEKDEDSFSYSATGQQLQELNLSVLFGPNAKPSFEESFRIAFGIRLPDGRFAGFDWALIEHIKSDILEPYDAEYGRQFGLAEVKMFVSAHLMKLKEPTPSTVCKKLSQVIVEFEELLSVSTKEEELQSFLTANPILIDPIAISVESKLRLGDDHITDYVSRRPGNNYEFIEIENANRKLYTKSGDPSAELTHAIRQTQNWSQWIHEHLHYAREKCPGLIIPSFKIIIGRSGTLNENDLQALSHLSGSILNTKIMTYDDLVVEAKQHLHNLRTLEERPKEQLTETKESVPIPAHFEKMGMFAGVLFKIALDQMPEVLESAGFSLTPPK